MQQFGEPPITPPEPKSRGWCDKCQRPIFLGEEAFEMSYMFIGTQNNQIYCSDCFEEWESDIRRSARIWEEEE